ncbi:MAG: LIC12162 family protein [Candidatus Omnitrophica bacterium]|nr:LIC12162 family protein [Candidatus Omnitrophota bacterium]
MKNDKVFLVTTAIEDFWDTSYRIIFLGEWCKRYSRKIFWQNITSETLPSYFEEKKGREIYRYLDTVFERLLFVLHKQMNRIHGTNFSIRYWRIIFGFWLINYIHVMYDRYKNLKHFTGLYPNFTSICLDKECFVTPKDTIHFVCHLKNDDYNLQIYSRILFWLGYKLPTKKSSIALPDVSRYFTKGRWSFKIILKYAYELICKTFQNKDQILLRNTYFSYLSLFRLVLKTKGAVWPCVYDYQDLPDFPINYEVREILGSFEFGENEFEKMLASLISSDIPQVMIEGYNFLREKVKNDFVSEPKAIMSGISWWFDTTFRVWAAESAEKGTKLLGVQHGGGYGTLEDSIQIDAELSIVDRFYSWGWKCCDVYAEVIPMPATKLIERKMKSLNGRNGVLCVFTSYPRYLIQFPWTADYLKNYYLIQTLFISHLSGSIMSQLRIRPHREDLGWDVRDRIRDQFPQIKIENWDIPFSDSLSKCSVFICDHPLYSTTFVEALINNTPTIAFYNPDFAANVIRDEAKDILSQLKNSSIIFEDPVLAAEQLNSVYNSIESWWNEPKRQEAIRNFLDRFGRISSTWLQDWSEEILKVRKT